MLLLFSGIPLVEAMAVFNSRDRGRIVILSTNIAESSITIPFLDAVVDFCQEKRRTRHGLGIAYISQASGIQRKFRAGRDKPGHSLKMMLQADYNKLELHREPSVRRVSLASTILFLLQRGIMRTTNDAVRVLQQLPSPPSASHVVTDVQTLEHLNLSVNGYLTQLGKAVAELPMSVEEGVILLSACLLGVGRFACLLLAATSSQKFLECLCNTKGLSPERRHAMRATSKSCDLFFLAFAIQNYRWGNRTYTQHVPANIMQEVVCEADVYEKAIAEWLESDDVSTKSEYVENVWSRVHFAFASGRRQDFALHKKQWEFVRLRDNSSLRIQDQSQLDIISNSMSFCMVVFNRKMRRCTLCTSVEVLAFSGLTLHGKERCVIIDDKIALHLDLGSGRNALNLGPSFVGLLDCFCGRSVDRVDIHRMRDFLQFWNTDVALCFRHVVEVSSGYQVSYDADMSSPVSSVPLTPPCSSSVQLVCSSGVSASAPPPMPRMSQTSSASDSLSLLPLPPPPISQPVSSSGSPAPPPPPPPPVPEPEGFVSFDEGIHLCRHHKPKNALRRLDSKYWFFQAVRQGCFRCVECCVRRHFIDKHIMSDNDGHTALDFARYEGNDAMVDFILGL